MRFRARSNWCCLLKSTWSLNVMKATDLNHILQDCSTWVSYDFPSANEAVLSNVGQCISNESITNYDGTKTKKYNKTMCMFQWIYTPWRPIITISNLSGSESVSQSVLFTHCDKYRYLKTAWLILRWLGIGLRLILDAVIRVAKLPDCCWK